MRDENTFYCEHCGKKISKTALFCRYCGARQNIVPEEEYRQEEAFSRTENLNTRAMPRDASRSDMIPEEEYYQEEALSRTESLGKRAIPKVAARPAMPEEEHYQEEPLSLGKRAMPRGAARPDMMPEEEEEYYHEEALRAESPGKRAAPRGAARPDMIPEEEYYEEDYSSAEYRPKKSRPLFYRVIAIILIVLFVAFAYGSISAFFFMPSGITKVIDASSTKKSDWSFQDFFNKPFLSKLSDYTGIKIDNVSSILVVTCGLIGLSFLVWFYYTKEYW